LDSVSHWAPYGLLKGAPRVYEFPAVPGKNMLSLTRSQQFLSVKQALLSKALLVSAKMTWQLTTLRHSLIVP
jgi:hypothetical protein